MAYTMDRLESIMLNGYLTVMSSVYIPYQSYIYANYIALYMLLVIAVSILTVPNTLTVLLKYINLNHNDNIKQIIIRKELPILGLSLPYVLANLTS